MTPATTIYALEVPGETTRGSVSIEPADPVNGVEMVYLVMRHEDTLIRLVFQAAHLIDGTAQVAGLGDSGPFLDLREFGERVGLAYATMRKYSMLGELPEPDKVIGRSPVWRHSTIDNWHAARKELV